MSVAIILRDSLDESGAHLLKGEDLILSAIGLVELEGGVYRQPDKAGIRRARLDEMLKTLEILPFTDVEAALYGDIVRQLGFSRSHVLGRMIAAHALSAGVALVTANPVDFVDIPGLVVHAWGPSPA